ncbi:hypothetical protein DP939_16485 [Spongiactinospora rosea]|uniref:Uncharacterized protein n=1 Tax=Spongiactinospora rosea TaxID=2248750 RepID=A0A366LY08_9ACTN|nr:hypothetical protein [Spongiactinospora rosea]RBQ18811.1 hypothetical protein DP939_16485 [Spongiactinospora rosea]
MGPELMRLASAVRAVLGGAASLAVSAALGWPGTALLAGGFTAMAASPAVRDLHRRDRLITLGPGVVVFSAAVAAGAVAAGVVFLVVICLAGSCAQVRCQGGRGWAS